MFRNCLIQAMKMKMTKKNNIIYLIDFYGHAAMDTEHSVELRFSTLKDIISMHELDKDRTIFVSTLSGAKSHIDYPIYNTLRERFLEMKRVAELYDWTWLTVEEKTTREEFIDVVVHQSPLKTLEPNKTQIIYGGTNTSGCVFERRPTSCVSIAQQGYSTTMFLPLCSDPGCSGRNSLEKTVKGYSKIYNTIKDLNLIDYIDLKHRYSDLYLPTKEQKQCLG